MDSKRSISLGLGLFVIIAVQIGGFVILWGKNVPPPEYVYLPATVDKIGAVSAVNTPVVVVSPPDEKALRKIIEVVLAQELKNYTRQESVPITDAPEIQENSPENFRAINEITSIVKTAIAAGKWTQADNLAVMPYANQLTVSQRQEIMEEIGRAVAESKLRIESNPPVL